MNLLYSVAFDPKPDVFNDSHACYYINDEQLTVSTIKQLELVIIGNIYSNPELLK